MRYVFYFFLLCIVELVFAQNGDFEKFKDNTLNEFSKEKKTFLSYKKEIEKEFLLYRKIVYDEFEKYKKEILKHWKNPEITNRKKFVEYSEDFKVKKVINFKTGEIKIAIISNRKPSLKEFERHLYKLSTETKREAFKKDKLSQNIEKRLKKTIKNIKISDVDNTPIATDLITGKKNPSKREIKLAVLDLLNKGKYEKTKGKNGEFVYIFKVKIPPKRILIKAKYYKPIVEKNANKYNLKPEIILAIIHTESSFNPMARSYVPAYGLMQIVPHTAGKDATRYLYGKPLLLSPSFLYNDRKNILIGSTYFYLLYYHYLRDIKNPLSRLYCSIAAYNTGVGNVARAFVKTRSIKVAVKVINSMTPSEVYFTLKKNLPYEETKIYLDKVLQRITIYERI